MPESLGFIHEFVPGREITSAPVLLLLHGTGGNEKDLLDLGYSLFPGAPLLSPRGKVLENGMPRFFRRLAEGIFDEADLIRRTHELADFVVAAAERYHFTGRKVVAVGYSNGANIAASMLLLHPEVLSGAVLFRAMVPLTPEKLPDLKGLPVLLANGLHDPLVSRSNVERLTAMLQESGADASLRWVPDGHQLVASELKEAELWLAANFGVAQEPSTSMQLAGIHHLTAVTAAVPENHRFYTEALGMRLVKKSVNQDDVSAYHLFYADGEATPGTDLTFFDWPVPREQRGTRSIIRTGLRLGSEESLRWWINRFDELGISHTGMFERDGRTTVDFEDPEGQRLSLVNDAGHGAAHPWDRSSVPAEHQIRGLGPITMSVPDLRPTELVLKDLMGMRHVREYQLTENNGPVVHVYEMGEGGPAAELHVAIEPGLRPARTGAGGVHHVAFRVPTMEEHAAWLEHLNQFRIPSSGLVDRYYFRSLYFREPNGILFELATDGPGFTADEPLESLGERLALPPYLEPQRREIEQGLKPLKTGG